jgi:hypothetical protein
MADQMSGYQSSGQATPLMEQYLTQTRPWVRLISVLTFIGAGLMIIMAIFVFFAVGMVAGAGGGAFGSLGMAGGSVVALFYILLAALYIMPGLYLARYASTITRLRTDKSLGVVEEALGHQRSFWRFVGIMTTIALVLGAIGTVAAMYFAFTVSRSLGAS